MKTDDQKRRLLQHLAEEGVPADHDPWETLRQRVNPQKIPQRNPSTRAHAASFVAMAVVAISIIFLSSPQGHATAQSLLRFFTRAGGDTLPLPSGVPTQAIPPTITPAPTRLLPLVQAKTPPAPTPAATPLPEGSRRQPDGSIWAGSLAEIQPIVDFAIRALPSTPPGYDLTDVIYLPSRGLVQQIYKYHPYQSGEMFIFSQQTAPPDDVIGQSATVEQIEIDGTPVEMVEGTWFTAAGGDLQETWAADAPVHTFRWQQDGFTFTLEFWVNETFSPAYLEPEDMQAMVEVAMGKRTAFPTYPQRLYLQNLSLEQAQEQAGYTLVAPALLPEGFIFSRAAYDPSMELVVLYFEPADASRHNTGTSLLVFQTPQVSTPTVWDGYPPEALETLEINGYEALLARGSMVNDRYEADAAQFLEWKTERLKITVRFYASDTSAPRLTREDMIAIAESVE